MSICVSCLKYVCCLDFGNRNGVCLKIETCCRKPETVTDVLVCSRGGGGLLAERMQVVAELWAANIKVCFLCAVLYLS